MSVRTITLTGRPPVKINEDNWAVIASASDKEYDNEYEFQADRISKWWIKVRRHDDGRAIVYAGYDYTTNWQSERSIVAKRGVLLQEASDQDICDAITSVCDSIQQAEHRGNDADRWNELAAACIADMPAEAI